MERAIGIEPTTFSLGKDPGPITVRSTRSSRIEEEAAGYRDNQGCASLALVALRPGCSSL
jgi:hypothetical protein